MCHFITCTLPASADIDQLRPIIRQFRMSFQDVGNEGVLRQLRPGEHHLLATGLHCDCGTDLGSKVVDKQREDVSRRQIDRQAGKLRRKGWSEAKVNRWLAQKQQAAARRQERHAEDAAVDLETWVKFIRAMLDSGHTDRLGVLLHWYGGPLDSEQIQIAGKETVRARDLTTEVLARVREDVLYLFR